MFVVIIKHNRGNMFFLYAVARIYNYVVRLSDALCRCIHGNAHSWLTQIQTALVIRHNILHYRSKAANGCLISHWNDRRYIISNLKRTSLSLSIIINLYNRTGLHGKLKIYNFCSQKAVMKFLSFLLFYLFISWLIISLMKKLYEQ